MVRRRAQAGYTLLEMIVAMTVFGIFLAVLFTLTAEMRGYDKRLPINFLKHPQVVAVISRLRRDVLDAGPPFFGKKHDGYENGDQVLVLESVQPDGSVEQIVWDFSEAGRAKRIAYRVGEKSEWSARGLPPEFNVDFGAVEFEDRPYGVRLVAKDGNGRIAIDQILQPRAHPWKPAATPGT